MHTKGNPIRHLIAWAIRWGTSSYWNHAVLIYLIPSEAEGFPSAFTIESQGRGIDIHKLADYYLRNADKYDLGIKRLAAPWYGDGDSPLALEFVRKVRGFALQEIDAKYSFRTILRIAGKYWWVLPTALSKAKVRTIGAIVVITLAIIWLVLWLAATIPQVFFTALAIGVVIPLVKFLLELREKRVRAAFRGEEINNYICSSFVQWAYYFTFDWFRRQDKLTPDMKPDQIDFTNWIWDKTLLDKKSLTNEEYENLSKELLSTTPYDVAKSQNLKWIYFIKDGQFEDLPAPS